MNACTIAAEKDRNAVVINSSTDGVSCEVQGNLALILQYLQGGNNSTSVPDHNHNIKNSIYQLLGGSSPASIGRYFFDPWMLKQAGIAQLLWRI